ncbi:trypsin-like peptidase domain-containing protein [Frankia sp. CNm7]|uniref:Trypsin-like peptidase domain-containing protein n=1 Tax=Frankia nepalensis TaxID=1836974 RepID=A0A937RPD7_9ACTN|nr:trypsin-like peptidase domain-containing protein [Frankia nepalensis]MBL7495112.1 trypsin-like peptidase domain-containing protein [Frankia nepalensis]MBL7515387.1 trypsin-like peptidase domain-containing protein [Frankia nepalensis]MBL7519882.1 trypsin-like peptidase domain-containing protein [Frankia nepalensis]MBL7632560.1 trypsin-like peptidase domain-containing protein [Frankia nepalensis]
MIGRPGVRGVLLACGVLIVALAATVVALVLRPDGSSEARSTPTPSASPSADATPSVADIYQAIGPSVVVVRTAEGSLGSGVIVAADGTVLTANHVVDDGSAVTLTFSDGTTSDAAVASADPATDIAALTPETMPQLLVPATLGGGVEVGGEVVAIGNPLGLTYSVSSGVVSGVGRSATTETGQVSGLIQFDASVNPGSSGGPLLDANGLVIGIVVSIADPGGDDAFAGIGFAMPIGSALGGGGDGPGDGRGPQI